MRRRPDRPRATPALPVLYGVIHALIDLTTVSVVFRTIRFHDLDPGDAFGIVLGYDLLAFGTQFLFGWVADRYQAARASILSGIALAVLAVVALSQNPIAAMLLAGVGNALFHLGAGAFVLSISPHRAAPAGVFVGPGALGLGLGMWVGKNDSAGPLWPLVFALGIAFVVATLVRNPELPWRPRYYTAKRVSTQDKGLILVIALLLLSIAIRSTVGMGSSWQAPKSNWLLFGIPLAGFVGKSLGGLLSDRLGWMETSVGALLLSAPLIAFGGKHLELLLPGLMLFQMTMPVTLAATALALPKRPATAFGLTTLALILGALPTFSEWGRNLYSNAFFLVLVLLSALAVFFGLRILAGPPGSSPAFKRLSLRMRAQGARIDPAPST